MFASYFGFAAFALAVGGGAGNVLGGLLFDVAVGLGHPNWVWYGYGMLGALLAMGLGLWAKASSEQ